MKRLTNIAVIAAVWLVAATGVHAQPEPVDQVVAIVNKDVVLQSEVNATIADIEERARTQGMGLPDRDVLEKQVIDHLITQRLQLATAERYGLQVSDEQINAAIDRMARNNNMSREAFLARVQQEGVSLNTLRADVRDQITIQQLQRGVVQQRIHISDQEVDNFLNSAEGQFWSSPEYHLGHILISLPQAPSEADIEAARSKAQALYEKLQAGAGFAETAIAESSGPSALEGGDLGWRRTSDLPSLFAEVVPELDQGEVSKPQRSNAGFHILKLYGVRGEQQQVVTQSKVRHILLEPSAILTSDAARTKLEALRQRIVEEQADFAALAKEHSDDISTALQGGDLGWANPDQFVPEFAQTIRNTPVGDISEPFQTQYGWHIVQVQDRREEDMTEEALRAKARNVLMSRRFEDELQIWLREIRDEAFVKIKSDSATATEPGSQS